MVSLKLEKSNRNAISSTDRHIRNNNFRKIGKGIKEDIGVAPQEQMRYERFPEHEGTHLRGWLIMQEQIQRMVDGFLLVAVLLVTVEVQRQTCRRFRQDADTGMHRRHLHGRPFVYPFARSASSKEKAIAVACSTVLGVIPGMEKPGKYAYIESPSFQINKRPRLS